MRPVADMLKAIHAAEDREAAQDKAEAVIEKLRAMRLKEAAQRVQDSIAETLTYYKFSRLPLVTHPDQESAGADHARDPTTYTSGRCLSRW